MASKLFIQALAGEERALVLLTDQIKSSTISADDLQTLMKAPHNSNVNSDYLQACLYAFGAKFEGFEIKADKHRAKQICKQLIEKKSAWANNLMYLISNEDEKYQKYLVPAIDADNPLALANYCTGDRVRPTYDRLNIAAQIYHRLSPRTQSHLNSAMKYSLNANLLQQRWSDIYYYYENTGQIAEAKAFLILAAKNNVPAARAKLYKHYENKSDVENYCAEISSILSVDIQQINFHEKAHHYSHLQQEYHALKVMEDEWQLFINRMEHKPELLDEKLQHAIAHVNRQFAKSIGMYGSAISKMQSGAHSQFGEPHENLSTIPKMFL